jgi:hypothetical protein
VPAKDLLGRVYGEHVTSFWVTGQGRSKKKVQQTMELDCGSEERQLLVDRLGTTSLNMEERVEEQTKDFTELVRRSQEEDLTEVEKSGCLYQAGVDRQGRPVIVFIGKWFKPELVDMKQALLYLIRTLDPVVDRDYSVVYFCTRTSSDNMISYWWMKEIYSQLPYHYKKNLKDFYTVHPSMWTRLTSWWFTTFMAPAIKHKLHNIHEVKELDQVINSTEFDIPMFIQEYDMSINGLRYYQP